MATATDVAGPTPTATPASQSSEGCGSATLTIDYAPFTTATLVGSEWELVVADVEGIAPAIFNTLDGKRPPGFGDKPISPAPNPNAETLIYTPVDVTIDEAISGPSMLGPSRFLVAGGTVGCFVVRVYPSPSVVVGSRYVFILTDVWDDTGEKVLALEEAKFAWRVNDHGIVATVDGPMSIDELTRIVSETPPSPEPSWLLMPEPQQTAMIHLR